MLFRKFLCRAIFVSVYLAISLAIGFSLFYPIFMANSVIIPYSVHPYDICIHYPAIWSKLKGYFLLFYALSSVITGNFAYSLLLKTLRF